MESQNLEVSMCKTKVMISHSDDDDTVINQCVQRWTVCGEDEYWIQYQTVNVVSGWARDVVDYTSCRIGMCNM